MITLLVTQLVFTLLTVQGFEYKIDTERCKANLMDTTCFVRGSCVTKTDVGGDVVGNKDHLVRYTASDAEKYDERCDVIMQIKVFSVTKWHVMIEVKSESKELKFEDGIKLSQKDDLIICKPEIEGKLKGETSLFGKQTYSKDRMFCSFFIEHKPTVLALFSLPEYTAQNPTLGYATENEAKLTTFQQRGVLLWITILRVMSCDPSEIQSKSDSTSYFILHEADTTLSKFSCPNPENRILLRLDGKDALSDVVYCKTDTYVYKMDENEIPIPLAAKMEIYCAEEFCSKCSDLQGSGCTGCEKPDLPTGGNCKTATCGTKKWRQFDGSLVDATVECKRSEKDKTKAGWFMTIGSNTKEITEGACSEEFDCPLFSKLDFTCYNEDCIEVTRIDGTRLSCPKEYDLMVEGYLKAETGLECNISNGHYYSKDVKVEKESHVICRAIPPSSSLYLGIIIGSVITSIAIIIVVALIYVFKNRKDPPKPLPQPSTTDGNR